MSVNASKIGQLLSFNGWVKSIRPVSSECMFITLHNGLEQLQLFVSKERLGPNFDEVRELPNESVISASGHLRSRPEHSKRACVANGEYELEASDIFILNKAQPVLPIIFKDNHLLPDEDKRLEYRYLDLRRPEMQQNIRFRSRLTHLIREKMQEMGFVDIETPLLFKPTPEGAAEFTVSRGDGYGYALPQSPQQFKQLLVIGGFEKYYQIARCFRNEDLRSDRQPEFTQLDMEMGFAGEEEVIRCMERLLVHIWDAFYRVKPSFHRLTYDHALSTYGIDKPSCLDRLRIVTEHRDGKIATECLYLPRDLACGKTMAIFESLNIDGTISRSIKEDQSGRLAFTATRDLRCNVGCTLLGRVRQSALENPDAQTGNFGEFLWITRFPLFCKKKGGNLESMHHPFTAPIKEHVPFLHVDPLIVRAQHYDLVFNGVEIGGGSVRIHDSQLQEDIMQHCLRLTEQQLALFRHLTEALKSGAPPHAGIALGLDRLVAVMRNAASIRDVIAFPKNSSGFDSLFKTPSKLY